MELNPPEHRPTRTAFEGSPGETARSTSTTSCSWWEEKMARLRLSRVHRTVPVSAEIEADRPESGLGPRTSEPDPQPRRTHMIDDARVQEEDGREVVRARLPRRGIGSARVRWRCRTDRSGPAIPPVLRSARRLVSSRPRQPIVRRHRQSITTSVSGSGAGGEPLDNGSDGRFGDFRRVRQHVDQLFLADDGDAFGVWQRQTLVRPSITVAAGSA